MSDNSLTAIVDALYIYPIKACAGLRVPYVEFTEEGLTKGDREWVIVNDVSEVVWQGSHPQLALVRPHVSPGLLHLSGPAGYAMTLSDPPTGAVCHVKIWNNALQCNEEFEGIDAGDRVCKWLGQIAGSYLRLVRLTASDWVRATPARCHITSTISLAELHAALAEQNLPPAEMERFRPNIVIANGSMVLDPFIEDYCTAIRWLAATHAAEMVVRENCIRCIVPNVDPNDATVNHHILETVTRLSAQRHPGMPVYFGIYAQPRQTAQLQSGATLELMLRF